jgi:hypothetical protein
MVQRGGNLGDGGFSGGESKMVHVQAYISVVTTCTAGVVVGYEFIWLME